MNPKSKPLVTVLMPVYNGASSLEKTLNSVLQQTFRQFEFLIVDDGSTDRTAEILGRTVRKDRRVRVLHNVPNQGIVRSLNKGLQSAKGFYIARIDCGDICDPQRLAAQIAYFKENPGCVLLGTQINRVNQEGRIVGWTNLPEDDRGIREALFCRKSVIAHPSAMYRRIPGLFYREGAYPAEDYDYWLRMAQQGKVGILGRRLVNLVNDPASISHKNMVKQVVIVRKIRNLLIERLKYGRELHPLPDFRAVNPWRWKAATWLYGYKIRKNYYRYHPMNFLLNAAITLLCPSTLVPRTPLVKLAKILHRRELEKFCAPTRKAG